MGWYYYLAEHLGFPFKARCVTERATSPLEKGETITALAMAPETECEREMFVRIAWHDRTVAVPLVQLMSRSADPETRQAMEDWHFWVGQGHMF